MEMIRIELLPARHGDCIWLSWGPNESKLKHMIIDTGFEDCANLLRKRLKKTPVELMVLTHIDADHIEGGVYLLQDEEAASSKRIKEVWFNGWRHIDAAVKDKLGAKQGEYISGLIRARKLKWNARFGGKAVMVPDDGELPVHMVGGMRLTLLSPTRTQLKTLRSYWVKQLKGKLDPGDEKEALALLSKDKKYAPDVLGAPSVAKLAKAKFYEDDAPANGSSIAFLAEYDGYAMMFTGDAFPSVLADSLDRIPGEAPYLHVLKLPHHGSAGNTSRALIDRIWYEHVLVSTDGIQFAHPSDKTIARLLDADSDTTVHFNYEQEYTKPWLSTALVKKHGYRTHVGKDGYLALDLP
jgi:hypothetical protein